MFPVIQIGPLALQTPGLILIIGLWLGLWLAEKAAPRYGVDPNELYSLSFWALGAGVVGARLGYVLRYPFAFTADPLGLFSLNPGLFDLWSGVVAGGVAALIYGQRRGMALWPTLDALAPALAALGVAAGLAHLASGEAYGAPADLPWAIELWGTSRHPSQVYETIAAAAILWAAVRPKAVKYPGRHFLLFVALTAGARLFLEAFRGDGIILVNGIRLAQVTAWLVLAVSFWFMRRQNGQRNGI